MPRGARPPSTPGAGRGGQTGCLLCFPVVTLNLKEGKMMHAYCPVKLKQPRSTRRKVRVSLPAPSASVSWVVIKRQASCRLCFLLSLALPIIHSRQVLALSDRPALPEHSMGARGSRPCSARFTITCVCVCGGGRMMASTHKDIHDSDEGMKLAGAVTWL